MYKPKSFILHLQIYVEKHFYQIGHCVKKKRKFPLIIKRKYRVLIDCFIRTPLSTPVPMCASANVNRRLSRQH